MVISMLSYLHTIAITIPIGSMYGTYGNIYHQYTLNVSIYIYIHHIYIWILWVPAMAHNSGTLKNYVFFLEKSTNSMAMASMAALPYPTKLQALEGKMVEVKVHLRSWRHVL